MTAAEQTTRRSKKGLNLPPYVVIPLVLVVILASIWFLWSQLYGQKPVDLSQFESNDSPEVRIRTRLFAPPTTARAGMVGVVRRDDGSGDIHIPGARARVLKTTDGWRANLAYLNQQFIPLPDRQAVGARFTAMSDKAKCTALNITDDQIAKLRALKIVNEMAATDADHKTLTDLWEKYATAPDAERPGIEVKLTDALRTISVSAMTPTMTAAADYAKQIHAILTTDQIEELAGNRPAKR